MFIDSLAKTRATIAVELKLFLRDASFVGLLAILLGLCYFLTPSQDAGYAVITFANLKPIMNADTSLAAASLVFALLIFPVYLLLMGIGKTRDDYLGVNALVLENQSLLATVIGGRIIANIIKTLLLSIIVLIALVFMGALQFNALPNLSAVLFFFTTLIPVGIVAIAGGILLDCFFPARRNTQAWLAFALWQVSVLLGMLQGIDIYGMDLTRPITSHGSLGLGFIKDDGLATFIWTELASPEKLIGHFLMYTAAGLVVLSISALLVYYKINSSGTSRHAKSIEASNYHRQSNLWKLRSQQKGEANPLHSASILFAMWFRLSPICKLIYLCLMIMSLIKPEYTHFLLPVALIIPCIIFRGQNMQRKAATAALECSTPALQHPTAMVFQAFVFTIFMLLPVAPAVIYFDGWRLMSLLLSTGLSAWWMFWTHHGIERPLLGTSVYAIFWYVFAVNKPPASLDFFGIHSSASHSFSVTILMLTFFAILLLKTTLFKRFGMASK